MLAEAAAIGQRRFPRGSQHDGGEYSLCFTTSSTRLSGGPATSHATAEKLESRGVHPGFDILNGFHAEVEVYMISLLLSVFLAILLFSAGTDRRWGDFLENGPPCRAGAQAAGKPHGLLEARVQEAWAVSRCACLEEPRLSLEERGC